MMVDAQIGRVLAALDEAGMTDDTLVIFTSDNGPDWYPVEVQRFGHDSARCLRGMKSDTWEAGHRMPFIVRWPGRVKAGSQSKQTICFTDLLATFADICGTKLPEDAGPDSTSFLPVLLGNQPNNQPICGPIVMQSGSTAAMTIREGDWKLIDQLGSGGFTNPNKIQPAPGEPAGQLYNLAKDLAETTNPYAKHPEIVARLTAEMSKIVTAKQTRAASADDVLQPYHGPSVKGIEARTLTGKVMCGYQGWFNCPEDGMKLGWTHWSGKSRTALTAKTVTVNLWPDLTGAESWRRSRRPSPRASRRTAIASMDSKTKAIPRTSLRSTPSILSATVKANRPSAMCRFASSTRRFRRRMPTLRTWTRRSRTKRSAPMPRWSKHWIATLPPFSMNSTNSARVRTPSWFYQRQRRDDKRKQPAIQCWQIHRL